MVYSRTAAKRLTTPFILLTRRLPIGKPFCKRPLEDSLLGHKEKKEIPVSVNTAHSIPFRPLIIELLPVLLNLGQWE